MYYHRVGDQYSVFEAADEDAATDVQYFGYLNEEGAWIIQKVDRSTTPVTYRFAAGRTDYSTAYSGRDLLSYGYFNELFT